MAKGHKDKIAVITGAANGIGQAFANGSRKTACTSRSPTWRPAPRP